MKIFLGRGILDPSKRASAVNCLLVNQFATPGLGSLMGGRYVAGTIQLLLSVVGFVLFLGWFYTLIAATYEQTFDLQSTKPKPWLAWSGLIIFGVAWVLSLFTSISLVRNARHLPSPNSTPPLLPPPNLK